MNQRYNSRPGRERGGHRRFQHRQEHPNRDRGSRPPAVSDIRRAYEQLTATHPILRLKMETKPQEKLGRWIDLIAPIGRGQRCLIVAPPKTGKTTLLKTISQAVSINHPDVIQLVLLVDERPEEVTDFKRSVQAKVVASTSDRSSENHVETVRGVTDEAMQSVIDGKDVLILLDSITRLARAFNIETDSHSKTLSGGLGAGAMQEPRKFFGAARKIDGGGSLTVVATALVDTGSRMDDVIFQEFKGTGNMELVLSRDLSEKRMFPAIDIRESGTRKEELLYDEELYAGLRALRQFLADLKPDDMFRMMDKVLTDFPTNEALLKKLIPARA